MKKASRCSQPYYKDNVELYRLSDNAAA